jgi:hypothetical protein
LQNLPIFDAQQGGAGRPVADPRAPPWKGPRLDEQIGQPDTPRGDPRSPRLGGRFDRSDGGLSWTSSYKASS